jgi:hypothetical protein
MPRGLGDLAMFQEVDGLIYRLIEKHQYHVAKHDILNLATKLLITLY